MDNELNLIKNMENNIKWLNNHKEEVRKEYKNLFIGIDNNKIISSDKSLEGLIIKLENMNYDPSFVLVKFITEKEIKIIYSKKNCE